MSLLNFGFVSKLNGQTAHGSAGASPRPPVLKRARFETNLVQPQNAFGIRMMKIRLALIGFCCLWSTLSSFALETGNQAECRLHSGR